MDCVSFREENGQQKCSVLITGKCTRNESCPFRLTVAEAAKRRKAANERLRSLPEKMQERIANNYYNGEMPWAVA